MSFDITVLEDAPVVIVSCYPPFDFTDEIRQSIRTVGDMLGEDDVRIFRIFDFNKIDLTFSDMVSGLAEKTRDMPGSLRDPRIRTVLVGQHEYVQFKAQALRQTQYGELDVPVFDTLDEAIAHCRAMLRTPQP
ncbi:MAG: hypothetical protein ACOCYT_04495 [Chloroflexota bacterium]